MKTKMMMAVMAAALMLLSACHKEPIEPTRNHISFEVVSQTQGQQFFVSNIEQAQISPICVDICMRQQNSNYNDFLDVCRDDVIDVPDSLLFLVDSLEARMNRRIDDMGLNFPFNQPIPLANSKMLAWDQAAGFTLGTYIFIDFEMLKLYYDYDSQNGTSYAETLLWHEFCHVLDRLYPDYRKQFYALIGFEILSNEIPIPEDVKNTLIYNPDVNRHDSYAKFNINGEDKNCMLVTRCPDSVYMLGEGLMDYFTSNKGIYLLALDENLEPYKVDGQWAMHHASEVSNFDYVMSNGNTNYCVDPEECIADNFSFAVMQDQSCPNQELLKRILEVLSK